MIYAREFFDLQLSFAERVQAISGMPLDRALLGYTNYYVRLGLGHDFKRDHPTWRAYLSGLCGEEDAREWSYRFYLKHAELRTAPPVTAKIGCFSYALETPSVARLHFWNEDSDDCSPLHDTRVERRYAELRALFSHLKRTASEDVTVVGTSWLYNLAAYTRLFPRAYAASSRILPGKFQTMPRWGQFLDRRGQLKERRTRPFLSALAAQTTLTDLERCFPLQPIAVEAHASGFYDCYGV